jgi:SAM-dependent methyltransferase
MNVTSAAARLRHLIDRAAACLPWQNRCHCAVCGRDVRRFLPYRDGWSGMPAVLIEQDVVGSDIANFECPFCGCHDRERHLLLYLRASGLWTELATARVLHLAPERQLGRLMRLERPVEYVQGDLYPTRAEIRRIDLMTIDCADASFDWVIANHVLEHVADDARALREIRRVLRPGGKAILQTPYAARLAHKREDAAIATDAARLAAYGQEDHCRLYGADFVDHVVSFGFIDTTAGHAQLLPGVDPKRAGVNSREPFLLFTRPHS